MSTQWMPAIGHRLLAFAVALGLVVLEIPSAHSQAFSVVHSFTSGSDGANPLAGLVIDSSGNLYGTSNAGGKYSSGAVFKVDTTTGAETVIYTFKGVADGADPEGALLLTAGSLYGTTTAGGSSGNGVVFEVSPTGKESVLYAFKGGTDGSDPEASLVHDSKGNLYGTTFSGGKYGNGAVFQLVRPAAATGTWTEKLLYSFGTSKDGVNPVAGVSFDSAGNLYGTTSAGGTYGYGTVFELSLSKSVWSETILHEFEMQSDGGIPYAGVIVDHLGNLYGATTDGGAGGSEGGGTVFEMRPSSGSWTFTLLYSLPGWGISGSFRNLMLAHGKIYATTHCDGANNAGTVYELTPSGKTWKYTSLYVFTGGTDGLYSFSNLVLDSLGNLYGTTNRGGANGYGVVFKVVP